MIQRLIHPEEVKCVEVLRQRQSLQPVRLGLLNHFTEIILREAGFLGQLAVCVQIDIQ
ncbi:hypothetical protein D3C81_2173440 [compost metagenome]